MGHAACVVCERCPCSCRSTAATAPPASAPGIASRNGSSRMPKTLPMLLMPYMSDATPRIYSRGCGMFRGTTMDSPEGQGALYQERVTERATPARQTCGETNVR